MLISFLKSYKIPVVVFMSFVGALIFFSPFRDLKHIILPYEKEPLIAFSFIFRITAWNRIFELALSSIIVIVQAFMINKLNAKYYILRVNSYLPGILFIIITGCLLPLHRVHPLLFSNIFLLMAIDEVLSSLRKEKTLDNYFNAGFYLFIGSMLYRGMAFYLIILYVGLVILRPFNRREWFMPLLGFILPLLMLTGIMYLINNYGTFYDNYLMNFRFVPVSFNDTAVSVPSIVFYIYTGLLLIYSAMIYKNNKIDSRKYFVFFFFLFLLSILLFFIFDTCFIENLFITAIPVAFFLSYFLLNLKSKLTANIIVIVLFGLVLWVRFFG